MKNTYSQGHIDSFIYCIRELAEFELVLNRVNKELDNLKMFLRDIREVDDEIETGFLMSLKEDSPFSQLIKNRMMKIENDYNIISKKMKRISKGGYPV